MNGRTYLLAGRRVQRVGFGAMQLASFRSPGPSVDRQIALQLLREAVAEGVDHIDTAHYYGPGVANELIHAALHPYPDGLVVVSKVGARRDASGGIHEAQSPKELRDGVLVNLASLQLDQVPVVNLRRHPETRVPFDEQVSAMAAMRDEGLIGAVGLSNITIEEYKVGKAITDVACVQNAYNLADRSDQALLGTCAADGVPYVPFFPLGSAFPGRPKVSENPVVARVAGELGVTTAQVALAWLLGHYDHTLLIPGTSDPQHLAENMATGRLRLPAASVAALDGLAAPQ